MIFNGERDGREVVHETILSSKRDCSIVSEEGSEKGEVLGVPNRLEASISVKIARERKGRESKRIVKVWLHDQERQSLTLRSSGSFDLLEVVAMSLLFDCDF